MSSATTNRPSGAMTSAARSTRFPEFGAATGRHNSDSSQSSTLGQTFGNGGSWQPSSNIWSSSTIGSGFSNSKRDASRSRVAGNDDFPDGPSGSRALAESGSEADPWVARANGPWNPPDTTSPTLQSHSGSTSPSHTRNSIPNVTPQTLLEIQNHPYQQPRPAIGPASSYGRTKSGLDPSSGSFKFSRKPSFAYNDDKENSAQYMSNADNYDIDIPSRYLGISGTSRDGSMPPSRASESGFNGGNMAFTNGQPFGSIGNHTPNSSIHSQRPSFSGPSTSFQSQTNGSRYEMSQNETDLSERFAGIGLGRETENTSSPQVNNNSGSSYSPNHPGFAQQNYPFTSSSGMWGDGQKAFNNFETYSSQPFAEQAYFNKPTRFTERGSVSPGGSEYRRGLNSPKYYSAAGTPPSGSDQIYRPSSRGPRAPQGQNELDRRLQNIHFAQQQAQAYMYASPFQGQYPSHPYDYPPPGTFRPGTVPYGYPMPMTSYPPAQTIPTRPAKDQDVGVGVRSVLLEEFRSNSKSNKRYELKDIYNHVVEFSGDQHGSRFIQQKLETANSDEKEQLFREIQPNALQLMTDVFGNYVIQKLFEHGNQVQKRVLAEQMKNHVMELSMQMYGCRVVQKALEHVLADQQAELVEELQADVLKCVKDQNGNHVVQKAIERVPTEHIQFVIEAFRGQVHVLATHPYGCRVIQRILEYCKPHDQAAVLEELHQCASMLITDQYGNYVTQHVIQHGKPEDRAKIIKIITGQLLTLSKHKFASNVVEKSIQFGTDEQRRAIVAQLTALHSDSTSPLQLMMKDQYGNYVIQKLLGQLKGSERDAFVEEMKPQLLMLKKYNYGKQIAAIEKLIFNGTPAYNITPSSVMPSNHTMPIEISSSAPTPMLTNGQNSPQSSSLPSTNVSTIDDAPDNSKPLEIDGKPCPEVVINGI
ncbi:ARM repeat-containing protein [Mollisia scopiformis]|uniref:Pumilio homology domain family member 3 n=1 Tax=Mollisia scopiformis TaxID=149040 RepID=A0A194WUU8_MOLSC|nr:ARM repeat-containing protein [Mollisia scopiformis]KUJ11746.1 ARM repeat-containing protein [Mollisia scopiformis]